jgi:two-component sensor histidine kinase
MSLVSTGVVTLITGFNVLEPVRFWSFVAISTLISWTVTLVVAALRLLSETNAELTQTAEDLKREVIAINNSYRQLHKGISRLLHGPVQEAITSSMLRLQAQAESVDTALDASAYAEVIRARVTAALELLNAPAFPTTDLGKMFADLEELWSGVVNVTYSLSDKDLTVIGSDRSAAYAVAELVREACSNATRHGNARRIDISVKVLPKERAIHLVVDNDGAPLALPSKPGIGSQLFEEQTLSWSRKQVGRKVRVTARLPLSATADESALSPKL